MKKKEKMVWELDWKMRNEFEGYEGNPENKTKQKR